MTNKYMYFIANWKMFGSLNSLKSLDKFIKFFKNFKKITYSKIIYCPPTTLINPMIKKLKKTRIQIGAQNCHESQNYGAFTGSINAKMLKEVGANTKGDQVSNVLSITNPDERNAALLGLLGSDALTQEAYNAVNNMNELIAQGERTGYSYENMLTNPRSPNYILQDVIDVYKSKIKDASFKDLEGRIDGMRNTMKQTMGGEVEAFKTYYIMQSEYFTNKIPAMANIEVPPRNENETISAYINRVQGLIKENNSLPSVITGDAIETLDVSDLFVTDE